MTARKAGRAGPRRPIRATHKPPRPSASSTDELVEATLRARIPESLPWGPFFGRHPTLRATAVNRVPVSPSEIVAEIRLEGEAVRDWSPEISEIPHVRSVQRLDQSGRPDLYRIRWSAPEFYVHLLEEFDIVGMVPFEVSVNGATLTVALSRRRLRGLMETLRRRRFEPELLQVRPFRGQPERGDLTPKQKVRFRAAVESGYFDVPRRVTLDELARRFSVRKSALAESLAHARRKVLLTAGHLLVADAEGPTVGAR